MRFICGPVDRELSIVREGICDGGKFTRGTSPWLRGIGLSAPGVASGLASLPLMNV